MTSFAGIAEAKDTSLAVVAPGIAEALAATAYGLAAAIPATRRLQPHRRRFRPRRPGDDQPYRGMGGDAGRRAGAARVSVSLRNDGGDDLYKPLAEINVTPLVDVMLVLLIIFMVTAPLLTPGVKVDLPKASFGEGAEPQSAARRLGRQGRDARLRLGRGDAGALGVRGDGENG